MMRIFASIVFLGIVLIFALPTHAQKSVSQLTTEINANFPDNTVGAITPAIARTTFIDMVNSFASCCSQTLFAPGPLSIGGNAPSGISQGSLRIVGSGVGIIGINEGLVITGTYAGQNNNLNFINIFDSANAVSLGLNTLTDFGITHNINGGSSVTGDRTGFSVNMNQTSMSGNFAAGHNPAYGGASFTASANSNEGASSASPGNGNVFGINPVAVLSSGATFFSGISGGEVDVIVASGASVLDKVGWQITQLATDAVHGTRSDTALMLSNAPGAVGWSIGIDFDAVKGQAPIALTGTAIATKGSQTFSHGVDFSTATISGKFLNGPSGKFIVDGPTGNVYSTAAISANSGFISTGPISPTTGLVTTGNISAQGGFVSNGRSGTSKTCTVNQALTLIFTLGILTGGTCNS